MTMNSGAPHAPVKGLLDDSACLLMNWKLRAHGCSSGSTARVPAVVGMGSSLRKRNAPERHRQRVSLTN